MSLLLNLNIFHSIVVAIVDFEQVNVFWDRNKLYRITMLIHFKVTSNFAIKDSVLFTTDIVLNDLFLSECIWQGLCFTSQTVTGFHVVSLYG